MGARQLNVQMTVTVPQYTMKQLMAILQFRCRFVAGQVEWRRFQPVSL